MSFTARIAALSAAIQSECEALAATLRECTENRERLQQMEQHASQAVAAAARALVAHEKASAEEGRRLEHEIGRLETLFVKLKENRHAV